MSDTPTPRTEKAQFNEEGEDAFLVVYASFARELERELAELKHGTTCIHHNGAQRIRCTVCRCIELERENTRLSEGFAPAINAIEIKARANEEAASRATEARDIAWSQGVAAGLRLALSVLPNA